jgi:crossover junction endodeoxyribonuclease RusA
MVRAAGLTAGGEKIALRIVFVPPSRRRYDDDNLLASFKAGRDGLADALGVDDRAFVTTLSVSGDVVSGGAVIVTVGDER